MPSWEAQTWFWPMSVHGHMEEMWWFLLRPDYPFRCHREMAVPRHQGSAWCYVPAISQPGPVTLDEFLDLSASWISSSVRGEVALRVCRGPCGLAIPIIAILHSLPIRMGPGVFKCSLTSPPTNLYPLPPTPVPNNSGFLFPRKPRFANGTQSTKNATQAVQVSRSPPLHPAEHRGAGRYLISLQYYISFKSFNPFNKKKVKTHTHN